MASWFGIPRQDNARKEFPLSHPCSCSHVKIERTASPSRSLNKVEETLVDVIGELIQKSKQTSQGRILVVFEGGHFSTLSGADEFSIHSQQSAFQVADHLILRFSRDVRIVFGILADDLGQVCHTEQPVCTIAPPAPPALEKAIEIPGTLYDVLKAHKLFSPDKLILLSEKSAKNRGIKWFREYLKSHVANIAERSSGLSVEEEGGLKRLSFTGSDGQSVLVADMTNEWKWISYCPLIMAQHYYDLSQRAQKIFPSTQNRIVVDFSFIDDRGKVCKGAELSLRAYPHKDLKIINVCFADVLGTVFTIDQHSSSQFNHTP